MQHVWIVESGEYDSVVTWGVASSPEAAERYIREEVYGPPYVVTWHELVHDSETECSFVGDFEAVPGKSTTHSETFRLERFELLE